MMGNQSDKLYFSLETENDSHLFDTAGQFHHYLDAIEPEETLLVIPIHIPTPHFYGGDSQPEVMELPPEVLEAAIAQAEQEVNDAIKMLEAEEQSKQACNQPALLPPPASEPGTNSKLPEQLMLPEKFFESKEKGYASPTGSVKVHSYYSGAADRPGRIDLPEDARQQLQQWERAAQDGIELQMPGGPDGK